MTKQTWTASVAAVLFVLLAAVIAVVPVPYVTWAPGSTHDLLGQVDGRPAISIEGAPTYPTTGQLRITTVAVSAPDARLSLPEVLLSHWLPDREALPRAAVYRPGAAANEISEEASRLMVDAQASAVVAGLTQSGVAVTAWPMVASVANSGPAQGQLQPGDLITAVDGEETRTVAQVQAAVADRNVGDAVVFTVLRAEVRSTVTVTTRATANAPDKPMVGVTMATGYSYGPKVSFAIDPEIGGSSAGLMFALAIHDLLSPTDLAAGRVIAGTGAVAADGRISPIGGVQEKIAAAAAAGASLFVLPRTNCADVGSVPPSLRLVPADTLAEATDALVRLADPRADSGVARCR